MIERDHIALANQYAQDVLDGAIPTAKITKLTIQRHAADLVRAEANDPAFPYEFDAESAARICRYIECHPFIDGGKDVVGKLITLEPWQCFIILAVFGWVNRVTGYRRFTRVYLEISKGNGKSAVSSPLCNYMAFEDGEPGSQVYSAATGIEQAKIIFGTACKMLRHPKMKRYVERKGIQILGGKNRPQAATQLESNSIFKPLSSDDKGSEGIKPHFIAVDELHAHIKPDLYESLDTATGKLKGSMLWAVTTAGNNRGSVCYEQHMYIRNILEGKIAGESAFGIIYTIDPDDSPYELSSMRKANPNWGVSVIPEVIQDKAAKAKQVPSALNAYLTKHLNVWVNSDTAGLSMSDWDAACDTTLNIDDFTKDECIAGIDLASRLDLASVAKIFRRMVDGKHHFYGFQTSWLPQKAIEAANTTAILQGWVHAGFLQSIPGATVDISTVIPAYMEQFALHYKVKEVALDPHKCEVVAPGLTRVFGEKKLVTVSPKPLDMAPAMKEFETLLIERRFHHSGDPLYTWAIGNVGGKVHQREGIVTPTRKIETEKIDPAIATMIALRRWTAYNEAAPKPRVHMSIVYH